MPAKPALWAIVTLAAIFGAVIMPYAILTAPAYIAVPVAVYLSGALVVATIGIGQHIVRAQLATRQS